MADCEDLVFDQVGVTLEIPSASMGHDIRMNVAGGYLNHFLQPRHLDAVFLLVRLQTVGTKQYPQNTLLYLAS